MSGELREELLSLVADALKLIGPRRTPSGVVPPPPTQSASPTQPKPATKSLAKKKMPEVKKETPSSWTLSSLETGTSVESDFSKYMSTTQFETPVVLILPEEVAEYRFFLENVSRAITRSFAPSRVALASENTNGKYLLAPIDYLKKGTAHSPLVENGTQILPLEPIENYLENRDRKMELWNSLKDLFKNTPLSS